ncbi:MAG: hypothetical protein HKN25_08180, partial [Pyrinomonadaceae bacterium]|nr:hypothetical protein [Pyrinomonadaceae bacterium]
YRVDLRLRPDGKNGANSIGIHALYSYMKDRAAIWEWLAYVKLRGIAGNLTIAKLVELETRSIIHEAAVKTDAEQLRSETRRIRKLLEVKKGANPKSKDIDIKFGEGGLQDIYFAIRYLQLRDNIADDEENRASLNSLQKLYSNESLTVEDFTSLSEGYEFLSEVDHNLRLAVGRSTRLPYANQKVLKVIAKRMESGSVNELLERLTFHRLNVHAAFESVISS